MKRKWIPIFFTTLFGLLLAAPLNLISVDAAETSDTGLGGSLVEPDSYGLIGDFIDPRTGNTQDWNSSDTLPFDEETIDEETGITWYTWSLKLEEGDEFKVFKNGTWIGYQTGGLNEEYFTFANENDKWNSNWKVLETGVYEISLMDQAETKDDTVTVWDKGNVTELASVTITYYHEEEVIETDEAIVGTIYNPHWVYQEGYVLEGWYKNPSLDDQSYIVSGFLVEEATSVYGKYSLAGPDLVIYHEGEASNAYYWNDVSMATGTAWPGESMTSVNGLWGNVHKIVIPAEYEASRIIFNDPISATQTEDLVINHSMILEDGTYPIWGNDQGWYTLEESEARNSALAFVTYWQEEVRINNDVCYLEEDAEAWNVLKEKYLSLNSLASSLVDGVKDGEGTIGETMSYLSLLIEGEGRPSELSPYQNGFYLTLGVSLGAILLLVFALLFFFTRKKKKN